MVIAAGSVMKEPKIGAKVKIDSHHAPGEFLPIAENLPKICLANCITGRVAAKAIMTTTNIGSV